MWYTAAAFGDVSALLEPSSPHLQGDLHNIKTFMQINLTPDLSLLAIMVIFFLNYLIVRAFFLKPINTVLEARDHETRSAEQLYEAALAKFNDATTQMEERIHVARRSAADVRERFRGEAGSYRQQLVEKTSGEGKKIVSEADEKLKSDVAVAKEKIVRESDSLARLAAEKILGRTV
jgi:F0F1-type ATP synthase membrane subunit b/b'